MTKYTATAAAAVAESNAAVRIIFRRASSHDYQYRNTGTSSFLEHFSQRLSAANVMHGAAEGLKAINRAAKDRIARKRRSDHGV